MVFAPSMTHSTPCFLSPPLGSSSLPTHGGDIWTAARQLSAGSDDIHDFSTNTFIRMAPRTSELIKQALITHAQGNRFLHYPDPHMRDLRHALAHYENIDAANILPGSGASELIWAALLALRPRKALFIGPLFSQYARACDALSIPWDVITPPFHAVGQGFSGAFAPDATTLLRIANACQHDVDLVIACSPNNPGTAVMHDPHPLLSAVGTSTLLLDVSYKDFLESAPHSMAHHWQYLHDISPRVITLGSMTKFFCCPGVRLGWVAAEAAIISRIQQCRPAWTMPALAQEVGIILLSHAAEYRAALPLLQRDVAALVSTLQSSPFFRRTSPGVSFAIAQLPPQDPALANTATQLREHLLQRHILIRVCDNIPGMPPEFVRIQAQPPDGMERIGKVLAILTSPQGA